MAHPYGHQHRQRRAQLIPAAIGTMCPLHISPRCTGLMTNPRLMQLDHTIPLALGGTEGDRIVCASCNQSAGATLGNHLRPPRHPRRTRHW